MRDNNSERGSTLILGIFLLTTVLGMIGLVTDAGLLLVSRTRFQNAVDSAALAGIQLLPADPAGAIDTATEMALANGVSEDDNLVVEVLTTSYPNDTMSVRVEGSLASQFASVLGIDAFASAAAAKARAGSVGGLSRFAPLAVQNSVLAGLDSGDALMLTYDSQSQTNGNSLALALPGMNGANDFRQAVVNGSEQAFCVAGAEYSGCTSTISTEPGQVSGPLHQAVNDLIQGTSASCDTFADVFSTDPGHPDDLVLDPDCNPFPPYNVTTSKRVVIAPVIGTLCGGRCDVQIVSFALIFVDGIQCNGGQGTCSLTGTYVERVSNFRDYSIGPYNPASAFVTRTLTE